MGNSPKYFFEGVLKEDIKEGFSESWNISVSQ